MKINPCYDRLGIRQEGRWLSGLFFILIAVCLACSSPVAQSQSPTQAQPPAPSTADVQAENDRLRIELDAKQQTVARYERDLAEYRRKDKLERDRKAVADIQHEVENLRGLKAKKPIEMTYLTPEILNGLLDREIRTRYSPEEFRSWENLYKYLGLMPKDMDLERFLRDLYAEQVAGLYDETTKQLYVSEKFDLTGSIPRMILAHEICHALQDENFNLTSSPIHLKTNDDRALAAMSVIEGDATLLMSEYMAQNLSWRTLLEVPGLLLMDQQKLNNAPRFISASLIFPYIQGLQFVTEAVQSWDAGEVNSEVEGSGRFPAGIRNRILADLPESSEQIIHPAKYLKKPTDKPTEIALDSLTSSGLVSREGLYDNVAGEFGVRTILSERLSRKEAVAAGAGWDGDRFLFSGSPEKGDCTLAWLLAWDTPDDAQEAADAFILYFQRQRPDLKKQEGPGEGQWLSDKQGFVAVAVNGSWLAIAHARTESKTAEILTALNQMNIEPAP
jgi:hypothetical protein